MWIFTVDGFFSVVEKREDKGSGKLNVRARVRGDLARFCKRMKLRNKILYFPQADYPYRVVTSAETWARYLTAAAKAIDYDNFKSKIMAVDGYERESVYLSVWSVLQRLERRPPIGSAPQGGLFPDDPAGTLTLDDILPPEPPGRQGRAVRKGYSPKYPHIWESTRY